MSTDYDDNGALKPGSKATYKSAQQIEDVNKYICTDPDSFAELKRYVNDLKQEYNNCKNGQ